MSSLTGSGSAADGDRGAHEGARQYTFHSDTPPPPPFDRAGVPPTSRGRGGERRVSALLLSVWACAALLACLLAGLLGFVELMSACDGTAELRFGAGIEVRCEQGGSRTDTPANAPAAVVLFSGVGLVVTLLLATWHGIVRGRENPR
ncbi:hypothetical protein ACWGRK_10000 [Saccharomonospora azurea]